MRPVTQALLTISRLCLATAKTPAFFLAGDSTTAVTGGWGDAFLANLISPAWGINLGKSGATTVSYEASGLWGRIKTFVSDNADIYDCFVTISFGHNDQKPASNVPFELYQANLIRFANEVKELGGTPLLVSSLTRRNFESEHNTTDSLANERRAAGEAATETCSPFINLNRVSLDYVNAIGEDEAHKYNGPYNITDNTHLNSWGETVFGRIVTDLVVQELPHLSALFTKNGTMSNLIRNGLPA